MGDCDGFVAGRVKRNVSREGENLEYLKNVVLQYMTSVDGEARLVILKAVAAVLKFTPEETERVRRCLTQWWWQGVSSRGHGHASRRRPSLGGGAAPLANPARISK